MRAGVFGALTMCQLLSIGALFVMHIPEFVSPFHPTARIHGGQLYFSKIETKGV